MWIGSTARWVGSARVKTWRCEHLHVLVATLSIIALVGCQHAVREETRDARELATLVSSEDLFALGIHHARLGDVHRAEQYLQAARQRGHDESEAVAWLVRVCIAGGRYHAALLHAESYLRDHPRHWPLRLVVASIHEALGNIRDAISELEAIVDLEPSSALAHYRLGMLYQTERANNDRVEHHLREYLRLAPSGAHEVEVVAAIDALGHEDGDSEVRSRPSDWHVLAREAP